MRPAHALAATAAMAVLLVGGCSSTVAGEAGAASGNDPAASSTSAPATVSQADTLGK